MSSNRLAERRGWRRLFDFSTADWSLRRKLVVQVAALLALVLLLVGVVTEVALGGFLMNQLDRRLAADAQRPPPRLPRPPREGAAVLMLFGPGHPVGTIVVEVVDGTVIRARQLDDTEPQAAGRDVAPEAVAPLLGLRVDGRQHTVSLGALGRFRAQAGQVVNVTKITAIPLSQVDQTLLRLALIIGGVAVVGLLIASLVGAWVVRRTLRPLDRVAATARRVAELPLNRGEVALSVRVPDRDTNPSTEVGQVGAALNHMLSHVADALAARQASESRIRQFVADASHELRTPLASIRGYSELTRRGTDEVPPDVAYAMGRIESESTRMTALVEELLLLARLDSDRPVVHGPVDLTRLVADAVADAQVAGRDHRWVLELPPEEITVVTGDAGQLHQVVTNLLTNARTHTPPGTVVSTSLRTSAGHAVLSVHDDGPGIPAELQPEVFERFARGDTSRSRAAGSTGLGLAIVAAVVTAHNGRIELTSHPGDTTLTVHLPLHV
ncbi:HAMP domain-containing histidine kinase [Allokutzneria sp. A3M-2-11 16]|uniref:sensor histidine kinase n=1 Tax=Allokutzneria sp. A3M-2-11 16 TaxID=2962043 RepID=UPI0020B78BBD|nr:HAMP domain-containing sensor histidine kinase [Allokutzneria sp. A3M-2-11 16]MCP3805505.1 HAMP domain-containing histidine kinase [Allokutzneria sp. A3M-2-11 16]